MGAHGAHIDAVKGEMSVDYRAAVRGRFKSLRLQVVTEDVYR